MNFRGAIFWVQWHSHWLHEEHPLLGRPALRRAQYSSCVVFPPPPQKKTRHRVKGNDFWSDFLQRVLEILVSQNLERFCWKEPAFQPLKVMVPWAVSTVSTFSRDELGKVYPRSIWDAYDVSRCLKMYLRCLRCSLIKATCIGPIEQSLQISYQGFIVS